jgi:hypothetical protein
LTGPVQQHRGQQLSASEEATLYYTNANNGGIIIDGIWLGEMKHLGNPDGWTECFGRRGKILEYLAVEP